MIVWMRAAVKAFGGTKMNILVKGDNEAKYPSFKGVMDAFKKNRPAEVPDDHRPEGVPPGTDLYKKQHGPRTPA